MSDVVLVHIQGSETVKYSQTVSMSRADFDKYTAMLNSGDGSQERRAEEYIGDLFIERTDVFDVDDFLLEEFFLIET